MSMHIFIAIECCWNNIIPFSFQKLTITTFTYGKWRINLVYFVNASLWEITREVISLVGIKHIESLLKLTLHTKLNPIQAFFNSGVLIEALFDEVRQ